VRKKAHNVRTAFAFAFAVAFAVAVASAMATTNSTAVHGRPQKPCSKETGETTETTGLHKKRPGQDHRARRY
jgi:hypothetical protein